MNIRRKFHPRFFANGLLIGSSFVLGWALATFSTK